MRRDQKGQGLVEFALIFPIGFVIILGLIDFSRAVYTSSTATEAARQAARTAIVDQTAADIQATAIQAAPLLSLTASNITVTYLAPCTTTNSCGSGPTTCAQPDIGCLVSVTVNAPFDPITPFVNIFFPPAHLNVPGSFIASTSVQPVEYVCPTASQLTCS
jgi:Flp pilus assembly protein TadG